MTATILPETRDGFMVIHITGAVSAANGGLGNIINPDGVSSLLIIRAYLHVITPSVGAANFSAAAGVASGAGGVDIIDTVNAQAASAWYNCFATQNGAKTAVTVPALWAINTYVSLTGSADTTGFVADLYLQYVRP